MEEFLCFVIVRYNNAFNFISQGYRRSIISYKDDCCQVFVGRVWFTEGMYSRVRAGFGDHVRIPFCNELKVGLNRI